MISPIFDQNIFKIISLFSLAPGSRFSRKEIKEKTKLNNVPLDVSLARLLKSEILKKEGYYSVNFENDYGKNILQLASKQYKQLKELPFDIYLLLVDVAYIASGVKEAEAHLFGSYSKLVYKEGSDIDIALLITKKFNKVSFEKQVNKIKKVYRKNVEILYFDKFDFYKNKKDPLVTEVLKNGIRLI